MKYKVGYTIKHKETNKLYMIGKKVVWENAPWQDVTFWYITKLEYPYTWVLVNERCLPIEYTKIEGEDNMTKLERIQEMEKQLQLLKEEVEQEEKEQQPLVDSFGRYLTGPKDGTRYYVLNTFGEMLVSNWKASDSDKKRLSKLSCFISKEKAQQYVEYTQAEMRILKRVAELNDGWEPTYTGVNNRTVDKKIYIRYNSKGKNFEWLYVLWTICAPFYLKTGELAQQLISEMEDDLKIYFRVEDK